jgi:hypothetical protein
VAFVGHFNVRLVQVAHAVGLAALAAAQFL